MSTYWHFECIDHAPPLASEEFTQHTDDAPYRQGIELAAARPLDPAWWESNQGGAAGHFERNARSFLDNHPTCHLEAVSEYGDRREVPAPNAPAPQVPSPADPDYAEFERHEQELFRHQPVMSREDGQIIGCQCLDRFFRPNAEDWGTHLALVMRSLTPHQPTHEQIEAVAQFKTVEDGEGSTQNNSRPCNACGDECATLSSAGLCDSCEALVPCAECSGLFQITDLYKGLCDSCLHNARRSGWEG